jgi:hypothetical protein
MRTFNVFFARRENRRVPFKPAKRREIDQTPSQNPPEVEALRLQVLQISRQDSGTLGVAKFILEREAELVAKNDDLQKQVDALNALLMRAHKLLNVKGVDHE